MLLIKAIEKCINKLYRVSGLLICVGIDTLAGFSIGKNSTGDAFKNFLEDYYLIFRPQLSNKLGNNDPIDIIYKNFRCGLVHSYSIPDFGSLILDKNKHLTWDEESKIFLICVPEFLKDFREIIKRYRAKLNTDIVLQKNFEKRYNDLFPEYREQICIKKGYKSK